ncbi:hypothetical protein AOQ84DRAFT_54036 [Glonium stellatum]|uniref:Uncharacterized protein n=1 Tax=Glonium stellatum TaxID=574774 RepID=A0A8E2JSN1_9PEZI|nr:hypothetical protein AOQ84DRAFT_54036 [Glonium stellatum]
MASSQHLDPHERPPDYIRRVYKKYQKMKPQDLDKDPDIIDFKRGLSEEQQKYIKVIKEYKPEELVPAFQAFEGIQESTDSQGGLINSPVLVYEHSEMPGIYFLLLSMNIHIMSLLVICQFAQLFIISSDPLNSSQTSQPLPPSSEAPNIKPQPSPYHSLPL